MNRGAKSIAVGSGLKQENAFASVSVIIPTKNRSEDLVRTIKTLLLQTYPVSQLVIVDQSPDTLSHDGVVEVLQEAKESPTLQYVRDTTISGGAVARNRAMGLADGDIWLFLDDDVDLEADFVEQIIQTYNEHPEAIGVSGVVTNYTRPAVFFRMWNRLFCTGPFWDERQPIYWAR